MRLPCLSRPTPQVLQDEKLAENSDRLGAILRQRLRDIPSKLVKLVGRVFVDAGIWDLPEGAYRMHIRGEASARWHRKGRRRWAAESSACYAAQLTGVAVATGTPPEGSFVL